MRKFEARHDGCDIRRAKVTDTKVVGETEGGAKVTLDREGNGMRQVDALFTRGTWVETVPPEEEGGEPTEVTHHSVPAGRYSEVT